MFTGIIKKLGKVSSVKKKEAELVLGIKIPKGWKVKKGDSIAVNGVCLTVFKIAKKEMLFFCQKETMDLTNLTGLDKGSIVNLEKALLITDEIGGHMVQGHVDAVTTCLKVEKMSEEGWRYWLKIPKNRPAGLVHKGSVALDGISLTVSRLMKTKLSVDIIPFTYENTNIQFWEEGTVINLETDIIGKYVENYMKAYKK